MDDRIVHAGEEVKRLVEKLDLLERLIEYRARRDHEIDLAFFKSPAEAFVLPFHEREFKTRIALVNEPDRLRNEEWADCRDHPDAEAPAECPRPSAGLMTQRSNLLEEHADTPKDVATGVSRSDLAGAALEYSCAQHCLGFAHLMR
ncbi:hypothetical protein RvVAR031_pl06750 (plasmid) [Agrobacterium vitis]|nr:hypothetical protein RvVAR031_pl06750 [Agrobacterium vitis]